MANEHDKRSPKDEASVGKLHDHERVDALMPWIKRGELEGAESDLVSDDLAKSPAFQAKLAQEGDLAAALTEIAADESATDAAETDLAWAKFKTRLPGPKAIAPEDAPPQAHLTPRQRFSSAVRTSAWRRFRLPQTNVG
ncbi:MAG: hypothetical protein HRT64_02675 [Erythrobacter sp.]|nr:hypothetical protein [Erythrobacter sp.]